MKKPDKENYHQEKSYRSISLSSNIGKIYERMILQETVKILEEKKFFKNKNLYAYQRNKNTSQAILPDHGQKLCGIEKYTKKRLFLKNGDNF